MSSNEPEQGTALFKTVVKTFLTGPLSILFIIFAILLGASAILLTPREEEPQIVVPMVDIMVDFVGHEPKEVEELVTRPLEKLLWQIDGVEHVYSMSRRNQCMVTVRFYVGEDRDRAMVKVRDKIEANKDIVPAGVVGWLIKPVEIDDVPIVTLTLASEKTDSGTLRRIAEELEARLASIRNIFKSEIHGGYEREIRVELDQNKMQALGICFADIHNSLVANNLLYNAGTIRDGDRSMEVLAGKQLSSVDDVKQIPIKTADSRRVYVNDVAKVEDSSKEPEFYHHYLYGAASNNSGIGKRLQAVTLSFSKKKGTNAVKVAKDIIEEAEKLREKLLPPDVELIVSRNYGETADEKVNELLSGMFFAIVTVVALLAFTMGWRSAVVVGISVPVSFALALFMNMIFGYTINRVTLFALILSLGLVVDDPITNVDNIQRHLAANKNEKDTGKTALNAVMEVISPVIMSTIAIIICFVPMFFITGMMGPYMGPMAINVPLSVSFSTLCALTFVPWLALKLLKKDGNKPDENNGVSDWVRKLYKGLITPFLKKSNAIILFVMILSMLAISIGLMAYRKIPLKMLPFDNKDELQIVLDMPEGSSLEKTDEVAAEIESYLVRINEVSGVQTYVGTSAPIDFNGLVRHYGMRKASNNADIRISLAHKSKRVQQSHGIAMRIRKEIEKIAKKQGAIASIVELPPGPPVFSTLTVEVYGEEGLDYEKIVEGAEFLQKQLYEEDSVHIVQIDNMNEAEHTQVVFTPDVEKVAFHGLSVSNIQNMLSKAIGNDYAGIAHIENERIAVPINITLPLQDRNNLAILESMTLRDKKGNLVALGELGSFSTKKSQQIIHHKNLRPVVFVTAECVGRPPAEIIYDMHQRLKKQQQPKGISYNWGGEGEWEITLRVFRDLGLAFGAALIGIYILLVVQMNSFLMPILVMSAIPLVIIGIAPGFYLLNLVFGNVIEGYADPVFFTATAMIGMIALGGIVIRNSLVLIEFIQEAVNNGSNLEEAIKDSGAVRFRPIMLTAATTLLGAWPITLDPIFSGLAWTLIFGLASSTLFTLIVVPTVYYFTQDNKTKSLKEMK